MRAVRAHHAHDELRPQAGGHEVAHAGQGGVEAAPDAAHVLVGRRIHAVEADADESAGLLGEQPGDRGRAEHAVRLDGERQLVLAHDRDHRGETGVQQRLAAGELDGREAELHALADDVGEEAGVEAGLVQPRARLPRRRQVAVAAAQVAAGREVAVQLVEPRGRGAGSRGHARTPPGSRPPSSRKRRRQASGLGA